MDYLASAVSFNRLQNVLMFVALISILISFTDLIQFFHIYFYQDLINNILSICMISEIFQIAQKLY